METTVAKKLILEVDGKEVEYPILNGLHDDFIYRTVVKIDGEDIQLSQTREPVGGWDAWRQRHGSCMGHFPVGAGGEFVWLDGSKVGT